MNGLAMWHVTLFWIFSNYNAVCALAAYGAPPAPGPYPGIHEYTVVITGTFLSLEMYVKC